MRRTGGKPVLMPLSQSARDALDLAISEEEFQQQVIDYAKVYGWKVYHTRYSLGSTGGYPDLTMVKGRRIIFAELKRQNGRVRPDQEVWLVELRKVPGAEVFVWRPSDWIAIETALQ